MSGRTKCSENQMIATDGTDRARQMERKTERENFREEYWYTSSARTRRKCGGAASARSGRNQQFSLAVNAQTAETLAAAHNSNS